MEQCYTVKRFALLWCSEFGIILLDMCMVLILSKIMRLLLKPLKQPKVVPNILAGIILGPSVLGYNEKFTKNILPDHSRFVIQNIGTIGFMFFFFVTSVRLDPRVIKFKKKHLVITITGLVIPHLVTWLVAWSIKDYMDRDHHSSITIEATISAEVITTCPVTYIILRDMHLLSSEMGRLALTTVMMSDLVAYLVISQIEAAYSSRNRPMLALLQFSSVSAVSTLIFVLLPILMKWINKQTPQGKYAHKNYVVATFVGVFVMGLLTDSLGNNISSGPFLIGLAMPDGPSIGATMVDRTEVILSEILLPFSYAAIGLQTDVFEIAKYWTNYTPIMTLIIVSFVSKLVSVVMAARFMDISYRDSLTLGFMSSLRGEGEFYVFNIWLQIKAITASAYSLIIIMTIIMTSISTFSIDFLYDPTKPYMINKKRTIQHTLQDSELRILACIYDQESVPSLFSLLDLASPTPTKPLNVSALYLVELIGRAVPKIIDHSNQSSEYWNTTDEAVHNVIKLYEETHMDRLTMNLFTSVTPLSTMYQDICEIALLNKARFIILPYHKKCIEHGNDFSNAIIRPGVESANSKMLSNAPCSVGILACKNGATWETLSTLTNNHVKCNLVMLFLGGPDAREALALVSRMVEHSDVSLTVVRFLTSECKGDEVLERKLDDGVVTFFWVKNEKNDRVVYKEFIVSNGFETISVIKSLNDSVFVDLWIVGRKIGINPTSMEGLLKWSENPELGLIGDFLISVDFATPGSVLVVQQQLLRSQKDTSWTCY